MERFTFELEKNNPIALFNAIHHRPYALFLDSADPGHRDAGKSFIFFDPLQTIETGFDDLKRALKNPRGITAGYFGYDLGRTLETLPTGTIQNPNIPDMAVGIYDTMLKCNHSTNQTRLTVYAENKSDAVKRKDEILKILHPSTSTSDSAPTSISNSLDSNPAPESDCINWVSNKTPAQYKNDVQTIIDYIHKGDAFQVNLAQRFQTTLPANFCTWTHYKHLRTINPAPFASYFNIGPVHIASCSPERFLTVKNNIVETRPIKGTLSANKNAALLEQSEKDRAENIMIVDLLRNDLSQICDADSINVPELCTLETFAGLHHLVSTIHGKLRKGQTPLDLLKACFPGGSITGAPKIRAMEIIEELEMHARGPYCGAIGYITPTGTMDTNILIRTLIYEDGKATFNVGGGITSASNPAAEYQETLDKAAKIFESFKTTKKGAA